MDPRTTLNRYHSGTSLAEKAYLRVRDGILQGEFRLGAVLSRRNLAKQFGMSFLPMSEALQRLEVEGLVESKPRVGTRVRIPTLQDVRESYIIREALESQSARLFAEKSSSYEQMELRRMAEHLDELYDPCAHEQVDSDFLYSVHAYHLQFHMRIAECTACIALRDAIEKNHVLVFNWLFDTVAERRTLPPQFHTNLIQALSSKGPEVADAAMREHVRYGLDQVLQRIQPHLDRDSWRLRQSERESRSEGAIANGKS
jgi:DNA-binding GntR family transcriptional regulator